MKDHHLEDTLVSILALTQHIQTRVLQASCRGYLSSGVRSDMIQKAQDIAGRLERFPKSPD